MDFRALSQKLKSLDPSTLQEDAAKLKAIANGGEATEAVRQPVTESVKQPVKHLDAVSQFKALAGIINEGAVEEGKYKNDAQRKAVHASKAKKEDSVEEASKKKMVKDPKTGKMVPDYAIDGKGKDDLKKESFDKSEFRSQFDKLVAEAKDKMPMDDNGTPNDKSDDKPAFLKGKKDTDANDTDSKDDEPAAGLSAKQKKLPAGLQKAIAKKNESVSSKKKTVNEASGEKAVCKDCGDEFGKPNSDCKNDCNDPTLDCWVKESEYNEMCESIEKLNSDVTLSFKDAMNAVHESGGQQTIDCVDSALWSWAQRVANAKYEGTKAEVFAGMLYERNGGRFEMHDILSEEK